MATSFPVEGWLALFDEWSRLVRDEREIRSTRRSVDELSRCCQERARAISKAATQLPIDGDVPGWIERSLLEAAVASPEHLFALEVLYHRKQFPRRYLSPYVQGGLRHPTDRRCENALASASEAYGREPVLRELVTFARTGRLEYERLRALLYYVRDDRPSKRRGTEHDLVAELIRLTSGGTVHWHRERPDDDE